MLGLSLPGTVPFCCVCNAATSGSQQASQFPSGGTIFLNIRAPFMFRFVALQRKTTSLPSVEVPLPGSSYNPSYGDHQDLLWKAAVVELNKEKAIQKVEYHTTRMFPDAKNAPTEQTWLQEMSEGIGAGADKEDDDGMVLTYDDSSTADILESHQEFMVLNRTDETIGTSYAISFLCNSGHTAVLCKTFFSPFKLLLPAHFLQRVTPSKINQISWIFFAIC